MGPQEPDVRAGEVGLMCLGGPFQGQNRRSKEQDRTKIRIKLPIFFNLRWSDPDYTRDWAAAPGYPQALAESPDNAKPDESSPEEPRSRSLYPCIHSSRPERYSSQAGVPSSFARNGE